MKIMSSHFRRKRVCKRTRITPNGEYTNQVDHVLVVKYYQRVTMNVKSSRRACKYKFGSFSGKSGCECKERHE